MKNTLNKIVDFMFSTRAAGAYLMIFAVAIGTATFIENDFGTSSAQALVYRAKWFELLLLLFSGSIIYNIVRFKMIKNRKWAHLIFHLSILIILFGAAITRYISYEGMMNIREGHSSNYFLSSENYLKFDAEYQGKTYSFDEKVLFSTLGKNRFHEKYQIGPHVIDVKMNGFLPNPVKQLVSIPDGNPMVKIVVVGGMGREDHYMQQGDDKIINGKMFNFKDNIVPGAVNIAIDNGIPVFQTDKEVIQTVMATQQIDTLAPNEFRPLIQRSMYQMEDVSFVVGEFNPSCKLVMASGNKKMSNGSTGGVNLSVDIDGKTDTILLNGMSGVLGMPQSINSGDMKMNISYGAKKVNLPFAIGLKDFIMDRYPGTDNPSSYASEVTLMDPRTNLKKDYRIYMNHILNYDGYRFFQSSYDRDEMGTYLSVNHDFWGTLITYLGYFLLTLGMIMTFFQKNSRFSLLLKRLDKSQGANSKIIALLIFTSLGFQQAIAADPQSFITSAQADKLSSLLVQDLNGRIKPVSTMSSEIFRKISYKQSLFGLSSDQMFWSVMHDPMTWESAPIISLGKEGAEIQKILGVNSNMVSFSQFFDEKGNYKLREYLMQAQNKNPKDQNVMDKALLKIDEKVNIASMLLGQRFLRIFPVPGHKNDQWISSVDIRTMENPDENLKNMFNSYYNFITSPNGENLDAFKSEINNAQHKFSADIIPSDGKIKAEIWLNKLNVFVRLMMVYGLLSMIVLALFFYSVFRTKQIKNLTKYTWYVVVFFFLFHTLGLALRWYVSGRAPWSNGYESMIYISWATMLAGLWLSRKSLGGIAATLVLTSAVLSVAAMSWLDPEITPLVPVLRSYWLTIHVAVIVGSYGFLLLGAVIAMLNLILMIFTSQNNKHKVLAHIKELTTISEVILLVGLVMLSVGTYLGGVWANESWGRYWGWDAKETWALVTVLVYSFILHMRLIPGLKSIYAYNFGSLFGFATVIMTYLGVNYYLSGLHSYAAGDPVPIPSYVYYGVVILALMSGLAYYKWKKEFKD